MSKESIRNEIRNKRGQIENNNADIREYTDRYDDLSVLKGKLENSQSDLDAVITSESKKAGIMKSSNSSCRFLSIYSDAISADLNSVKAKTAKESLSDSVQEVKDKMEEFKSRIEALEQDNSSLRSSIERLQAELRELEREEQNGI